MNELYTVLGRSLPARDFLDGMDVIKFFVHRAVTPSCSVIGDRPGQALHIQELAVLLAK